MALYKTAFFCSACDGELSGYQKMYSHGRCPLCGYKDIDSGTVVVTCDKGYKWVKIAPWWAVWTSRRKREYIS